MSGLKLSVTSWGEVALDKRELRNLMRSAGNEVRSQTARLLASSQGSGRAYRGGGERPTGGNTSRATIVPRRLGTPL